MIANAAFCTRSIKLSYSTVMPAAHTGTENSSEHLICFSYTSNSSTVEAPSGLSLLSIHSFAYDGDLLPPTTAAPSHKKVNKEVNAVPDWHDTDNLGGELKARK